jgi:Cu2+-exporting ATPase
MTIKNNKCKHCEITLQPNQTDFCCHGCQNAYQIINQLGLNNYYNSRINNESNHNLKPDLKNNLLFDDFVEKNGVNYNISLLVQGLNCGACVWLIEKILKDDPRVINARINLTKKILNLSFQGKKTEINDILAIIEKIGYKLLPYDQEIINSEEKKYNDSLLKALAVSGFGSGNIMLFSFALWFCDANEMGIAMHQFFQFISALIGLPVLIYSSRIFFKSAYNSLINHRPNMDLPISLAIVLASIVSVYQAFKGGDHVYFDSALMLVFFLLIGKYLDMKARKKAFNIATQFTLLNRNYARIIDQENIKIIPIKNIAKGMIVMVSTGDKIVCDGIVIEGESEIDMSLINGETRLTKVSIGSEVYAGTINMFQPIKVKVNKQANQSMLAQIIELINNADHKKSSSILLAEKLSSYYTPLVHIIAFLTFILWYFIFKKSFDYSLMNATAVLIITCPCALALAIPIVNTITISGFINKKLLIKNGEAIEKVNQIKTIIFDKTGTLTNGSVNLIKIYLLDADKLIEVKESKKKYYLKIASSLTQNSNHPIAKAISTQSKEFYQNLHVIEEKSLGLSTKIAGNLIDHQANQNIEIKIGRADFCKINNANYYQQLLLELHNYQPVLTSFMKIGEEQLVMVFQDQIKNDAGLVIAKLKQHGKEIILLSGDQKNAVEIVANKLQIKQFYYQKTVLEKAQFIESFIKQKKPFMMIGDGINDAPALSLATVSISFNNASDLSKNIADVIINSNQLQPILDLFLGSKKAIKIIKQNLAIALIYNLIAIPFAIIGMIVPMIAAIAMSSSSLIVIINSLRINKFFNLNKNKCQY